MTEGTMTRSNEPRAVGRGKTIYCLYSLSDTSNRHFTNIPKPQLNLTFLSSRD